MIKSNELRIGNFLQDGMSKELIKVIGLYEKGFETRVIDRSKLPLNEGWYAEPIPLTEEWLLKFGFLSFDNGNYYLYLSELETTPFARKRIDIFFGDERIFAELVRSGVCFSMVTCNYAHQLQNLYFALTGTELELK